MELNKIKNSHFKPFLIFFLGLVNLFISCKKFVDVDPPITSLTGENVYTNDATAISAVTGIYATMSSTIGLFGGLNGISIRTGLSADELTVWPGTNLTILKLSYQNALTSQQAPEFWSLLYRYVHKVNSIIQGLETSTTLTPEVKKQLLGEAKFLRAYFHFYILNLYGDIPYIKSTDWGENSQVVREVKTSVYEKMIADLSEAQNLLSETYLDGNLKGYTTVSERVRPTKWLAAAFLARVYLFSGDWAKAETSASLVLSSPLYDTVSVNNVFLMNSKEAIWQLPSVTSNRNTEDGFRFILTGAPNNTRPVYLSNFLLNSFEPLDKRRVNGNWVKSITASGNTYNFSNKYKVQQNATQTEYLTLFRLAEIYLIRAEARTMQNKIAEGKSDLDLIRKRAGLPNTTATDQNSLLDAIIHERQTELFTELGHRWFDLKRTGRVDAVMNIVSPQKGSSWNTNWQLYPIPFTEIQLNPGLLQNSGY